MVFSTVLFLFRFLPITLALYYLAPARLKNTVLFLCSLVFYSWGEVRLFPVMAAAILINYTAGLGIERFKDSAAARRGFLLFSIIGSLGMLFFFKYTDFFNHQQHTVIEAPEDEVPVCSVPEAGKEPYYKNSKRTR